MDKSLEMVTLYHYTSAEGLQAVLQSGRIVKQLGAHDHYTTGEAVFLTKVDPVGYNMKEILQNNYCGLHENAWLPRRDRASFYIKLVMDPEDRLLDLHASMLASRSVVVYKDEITLDNMEWTFGYPTVSGFELDPELERKNRETRERFLNHPKNENYKPPTRLTMPTLAMRPAWQTLQNRT